MIMNKVLIPYPLSKSRGHMRQLAFHSPEQKEQRGMLRLPDICVDHCEQSV